MKKAARRVQEEEEDDEYEFSMRKEGSSHTDQKGNDQKANTTRSKHSVTEQRRRCKINERFQILREIIPDCDLKRDKASFLLEVIRYIQFLQEKVQKYEASYQGWNQEPPTKLLPWKTSHGRGESLIGNSQAVKNGSNPGLTSSEKFDDSNMEITPTTLENAQNQGESDLSIGATCKPMDHPSSLKDVPLPLPLQPNIFASSVREVSPAQCPQKPISEADNMASQTQLQLLQTRATMTECHITSDAMNKQEGPTIGRGRISISSLYSQGLLNSLTQALQNSGVNLSQASISVQIDLGKQADSELTTTTFRTKDQDDPCSDRAMSNSRLTSSGEDSDQAQKKLKTDKR